MRLAELFSVIAPALHGQADPAAVAKRLFGGDPARAIDTERLAIYARMCRAHRHTAVDHVYAHTRALVTREGGEAAWDAIVAAYFAAHPMHHAEINANGAALPGFLGERPDLLPPGRVAAIAPLLADFEWWEWRTLSAPDEPGDDAPDEGPLRIAGSTELRVYPCAFVDWIDDADLDGFPEPREQYVLYFRDRALAPHRREAHPGDLAELARIHAGQTAAPTGEAAEALVRLHAEGAVHGGRATLRAPGHPTE